MKFKVKQSYRSSVQIDGGQKSIVLEEGQEVDFDDIRIVKFVERDSPGTLEPANKAAEKWLKENAVVRQETGEDKESFFNRGKGPAKK